MLNYRRVLIIVLFLTVSFSSIAYGATIIIAEITATSLNIRDQPTIRGKIIGSLKQGEKVIGFLEHPGWVTVSVNGNTPGYISSEFIKVLKVIFSENDSSFNGDEEAIKCHADTSNSNLFITDTWLKCKNLVIYDGYESCAVYSMSLSIPTVMRASQHMWIEG